MKRSLGPCWLWTVLLVVSAVHAQTSASTRSLPSQELSRKVELMIRLKFEVPTACDIKISSRTPSPFTGYDRLHVTLTQAGRSTDIEFLISKDNKSLARLENFDLDQNPGFAIDIQGRPIRGNPRAQVTVVNFDDLECPVCARMHEILKSEVMQKYGDKVRFIYKDNPLTEIHPWAMHAAVDAGCLAQQNPSAYWTFVSTMSTPMAKKFQARTGIWTEAFLHWTGLQLTPDRVAMWTRPHFRHVLRDRMKLPSGSQCERHGGWGWTLHPLCL